MLFALPSKMFLQLNGVWIMDLNPNTNPIAFLRKLHSKLTHISFLVVFYKFALVYGPDPQLPFNSGNKGRALKQSTR